MKHNITDDYNDKGKKIVLAVNRNQLHQNIQKERKVKVSLHPVNSKRLKENKLPSNRKG